MKRKIEIIAAPSKYGCFVNGADKSYEYLKDILNYPTCEINTEYKNTFDDNLKLKYVYEVMDIAKKIKENIIGTSDFPLIIGGDHSVCIGSIAGSLEKYNGDISVIYLDAHADIHNDITTPSGNLHGMPLSILIGRCNDKRLNIGKYKLNPKNIYFIGLRSYEKEEMDYIKEAGITYYTDEDVKKIGIDKIINDIKNNISTNNIHLSFDLDVMSNEEFNAVNINIKGTYSSEGGITFDDTYTIIDNILNEFNVVSMDMVEYNPLLDKDDTCKKKINKIIKRIDK